jgi:transposase
VIPIHPNASHATRPRWGAAGAKSDPGDSYKLADYLRTDGHRLRPLRPLDGAPRQLQALARVRDDHVAAKTAASNQLGALLDAHWPGAKQVFSRLGSQIALAFLDLPRIGEVNLAQVVAEVGPILDRAGDVEHASAECGATPSPEPQARPRPSPSGGRPTPRPGRR